MKTLKIHLKVCDQFTCSLETATGTTIKEYEDYVPSFMPEEHYGDYVILNIDVDTGQVTNWVTPTAEQMQEFIDGDDNG